MSWKVQAIVGERVCGSITRKMVLLNMASRANDDGTGVYASLPMIAGWCEVDARTVRRIVRDLEAEGLIIQCGWKTVKTGQINEWRVDVEAVERLPLYKDEVAAKRAAKVTPDTVSALKKKPRKSKASNDDPGSYVRAGAKSGRTQSPKTPDTAPASSIQEPNTLFEEANAPSNRDTVVQLRPGEGSEAVALYVEAAKRCNWVVARKITPKRQRDVRARLKECGGLDGWREQLARAEQQPFLGGASRDGWRMDLDFFASLRGWTAIEEGKYARPNQIQTYEANANVSNAGTANITEPTITRERINPLTAARRKREAEWDAQRQPIDFGRMESERVG